MRARRPFYAADLAFIHDAGFGAAGRAAATALARTLRARGLRRGLVVDLGCGSGGGAAVLAAAGYDVLGVDLSASMLALARRRVRGARFRRGSVYEARIPPCVGMLAAGEVLNYVTGHANTGPALRRLLGKIEAALAPGGVFLFDMAGPGRGGPNGVTRSWSEGPGWAVLSEAREDAPHRTLTRRIVSFRRSGRSFRRTAETHRLRLVAPAAMVQALRRAGFRASRLPAREAWTSLRGWTSFRADKPAIGRARRRPR